MRRSSAIATSLRVVDGVTGTPSISSKEKGAEWFDWLVDDLSALITKGKQETPPLAYSYFEKV